MSRKRRPIEILKQMKPEAVRKLAFAVFLMFGILGPLSILMESRIHVLSWKFILIQTVASGGIAASIILFARRRWWVMVLAMVFWSGVMVMNSGGLSLQFDEEGKFRVRLGGLSIEKDRRSAAEQLVLTPSALDAIYVQRGILGLLAIALLSTGYVVFLRVIRGEVQQRERLETEVRIARDIQQSLLPPSTYSTSSSHVMGMTLPATEVGGDYFDIVPLKDDCIALAIADVTGHGVGAGILSAMTKSAFRLQLGHDPSAVGVLTNLNETIYQLTDEKMFVTFAYLLLDAKNRAAQLATAGHPPVLIRRGSTGAVEQLRSVNLALGMRRNTQFTDMAIQVNPGDTLLLYTDGVVDARDANGDEFGMERLIRAFAEERNSPAETCGAIHAAITTFAGDAEREDDVSLLCANII